MRLRVIIGILLMLIAFAALFLLMLLPTFAPENTFGLNLLETFVCDPGWRAEVKVQVTQDSDGTGYTPILTCIGREGERVDSSGKHFAIGVIAFTIPFLIGLFLTIGGRRRNRAPAPQTMWMPGSNPQPMGFSTGSVASSSSFSASGFSGSSQIEIKDGSLFVDGVEIMKGVNADQVKVFQSLSPLMIHNMQHAENNLVSKLKEARDAGLISSDEYDRLRQELLDKLA